jgi:hypothetical protein
MTIQRTTTGLAAALALLLGATAAEAGPITVDFTVTSNSVSNPSYDTGVTGGGYFTFDDALMPVGGSGLVGNPILGLATLDCTSTGSACPFDESTAKIGTLTFTGGVLSNWTIGGTYSPGNLRIPALCVHVERRHRARLRRARLGRPRVHRRAARGPCLRPGAMVSATHCCARAEHACAVRSGHRRGWRSCVVGVQVAASA